ncbi:MAG TPA: asparagine synthase (glutamine-hydrolyzing), partial [Thermoanaerobaculia bacterium]|nr:asparagine synthase (glutamine-hydrolyzing) [Thermoanaerobaculia bacterium]
ARDGFGVKPMYYAQTDRGFVFASELKAILLAPGISRDLDYVALHEYLAYLWATAPRTPFKAIRKLPPGMAMLVREGRIEREWAFYDWPYGEEPLLDESEDQIAERLRDAFETSVRRQLVSDVPVGAFLSGGLDSSAIVAMMRRNLPAETIPCYTIQNLSGSTADAGSPDDLPFAKKVAQQLGVDLRIVDISPSIIDELPRMLYHLDEPQGDPAPINSMLIADRARADGIKVLMSGSGGDDVFTGYRRHAALRFEPWWDWLPSSVKNRVAKFARSVASGNGMPAAMHRPAGRRLAKAFSYANLDSDSRIATYFFWSTEELRRPLYSREFSNAVAGRDTIEPLLASLGRIPREHDPINRMLYLEAKHFLADHNLNYADKTTMAAGVESRVPFLDPDLVRLATRIPSRMKQKGSVGKAILKKAMEPFLPRDVIYRPKTGFGAPIRHWLRTDLKPQVDDLLSAESLRRRGLFDPEAVKRLIELDRAGRVDGGHTIFSLLCIEMWCQIFV